MCQMIAGSCILQEVIRLLQGTSAALKAVSREQKWITVSERLQIKAWVVDENWIRQLSEHQTLLLSEEDAHTAKQPIRHLICSLNEHLSVWAGLIAQTSKVHLTSRTSADSLQGRVTWWLLSACLSRASRGSNLDIFCSVYSSNSD